MWPRLIRYLIPPDEVKPLKQNLTAVIEVLELPDLQKQFLCSRWLDQILWMDYKANGTHFWYNVMRAITLLGGVFVPVLVGLNVASTPGQFSNDPLMAGLIKWGPIIISPIVAVSATLMSSYRFGERWQHYRQIEELLKIEGWRFIQQTDYYRRYASHLDAYPAFASRVERILKSDVQTYFAEIVRVATEDREKLSSRDTDDKS
jgi:hypothetical protein